MKLATHLSASYTEAHWSRRTWLQHTALGLATLTVPGTRGVSRRRGRRVNGRHLPAAHAARLTQQGERLDPAPWDALAQRAVEAAQRAGARYAEARLTRLVYHSYAPRCGSPSAGPIFPHPHFLGDHELVGVGVRALVEGYWGFAASAVLTPDEVVRLAQDAVAQAKVSAKGPPWTVDLGKYPVATGHWSPPGVIDPFTIPIEDKLDTIASWADYADAQGMEFPAKVSPYYLNFARQERVVANSEGARFTQTLYESAGSIPIGARNWKYSTTKLHGLELASTGWDLVLDAKIPEQFRSGQLAAEVAAEAFREKPLAIEATVGKYTLVCDGATMATLVESTLGVATQLDRALGYESNANGTSWIDDPLGMLGTAQVTSPLVTLTANRSVPKELATVKWDEEGVEPEPFTLIKDGVLVDFQTTREQAAWLASYYQKQRQPVTSHGCAAAENAHFTPLQQMPNLSLEPHPSGVRLEDLVADVKDGILIERGIIAELDSQARTGLLVVDPHGLGKGQMREIRNGRLGKTVERAGILFSGPELWKAVKAVGGPATQARTSFSSVLSGPGALAQLFGIGTYYNRTKGEPRQQTSHSVRAAAATIANQPLINPMRKA